MTEWSLKVTLMFVTTYILIFRKKASKICSVSHTRKQKVAVFDTIMRYRLDT